MLVCWEWLCEYVDLNVDHEDMALKFAMSGLNHESTEQVGSDLVLDLEVTSNRGDCLGHVGVAREAAVLLEQPLKLPSPTPAESTDLAADQLTIENRFPDGCPEYTARIIRGVKIGPSPEWLVRRLAAVGINAVNNVVDATNYVMLELGQPLHAFDLKHVGGGKIVVRQADDKEAFLAIDHKTYELDSKMVVIADSERAIALGGVMGGADSEVSESTTDLLIEAARFQPLAIRRAARKLKLHSPSSHRFERTPDPRGLDAASLRCCELIIQFAGGELSAGVVRSGSQPLPRKPIAFRHSQIERVLGISVPSETVTSILTALGCKTERTNEGSNVVPPSWRSDLQREIDLIEEVARIHGYDKIPEDVAVPLGIASPRPKDIALQRARHALSAYGVDEAMTASVVTDRLEEIGSVWTDGQPLAIDTPLLVGSKLLRRSLTPSLLAARYANQSQAIRNAQLYEVANVYSPSSQQSGLPIEQCTLGIVTGGSLQSIKGIVEELATQIAGRHRELNWSPAEHPLFELGSGLRLSIDNDLLGFVGLVSGRVLDSMSLDAPAAAAEINFDVLTSLLEPVRTAAPVSQFPAISRDLNFVVDEPLSWADLSSLCGDEGSEHLRKVEYQETYRDAKRDGPDKKRILLTLHFQSLQRTLTGSEVDKAVESIVQACKSRFKAGLLA